MQTLLRKLNVETKQVIYDLFCSWDIKQRLQIIKDYQLTVYENKMTILFVVYTEKKYKTEVHLRFNNRTDTIWIELQNWGSDLNACIHKFEGKNKLKELKKFVKGWFEENVPYTV